MSGPPPLIASSATLLGRSSSHFTRLTRLFAHEAGVAVSFQPIADLRDLAPETYGGHPALKAPVLHIGGEAVFGAENICRRLVEASPAGLRVTWPEHLAATDLRNAHELVWQGLHTQTQLVFGLQIAHLPAANIYFAKAATGLAASLDWLQTRLPGLLGRLPSRELSLIEAALFCLLEHMDFRRTADATVRPNLSAFREAFSDRASARATPYGFDPVVRSAPRSAL